MATCAGKTRIHWLLPNAASCFDGRIARRHFGAHAAAVNFLSLIEAKRDGGRHSPTQVQEIIGALVAGRLPDYQVAAWLMAVFFRGLDREELAALTLAMRDSGEKLEFPSDPRPLVDKHSTGGVGDKVSLPLAPLLASLGFRVPMISGRALGITGGTLDKLESIPGFRTNLSREEIVDQVQSIGVAMAGQTERMVPADRILYALRDVTGTVPSIPLITASILSKKLAESLDALVLDVKFGRAAFMQTKEDATELARTMVQLARDCGVNTRALLTDMNTPLGRAVGNWLEVKESVECLSGRGAADLRQLVVELAAQLLLQTGRASASDAARAAAATQLDSGDALRCWEQMLAAQGTEMGRYHDLLARDTRAECVLGVLAESDGWVADCDARRIGEVLRDSGAGRTTKGAIVRAEVGLDRLVKVGAPVTVGAPLFRIHARTLAEAKAMARSLQGVVRIGPTATHPSEVIAIRTV